MESNRIVWAGWETIRLIGRGSFGAVYEIQRDVFGDVEKAALKVISIPQNVNDIDEMYNDGYDEESISSTFQSHLRSIVAEYSLMRKLNGSANIVSCDDVRYVQHDDGIGWDIFIKMELLTSLPRALPAEIPEATVIKIAKDMCAALELCKKHGIIHRDIKPQNIFVSSHGDYKLGDFGIAKTVEGTMGGTKIGTYKYMAPEVYNNQPYGSGADIYSLGLVLYWLLNERRMPFLPQPPAKMSASMEEKARQRRFHGEPIPAPKNGSEGLKAIVLKACAYDLKDRYTSATQMLADLNALHVESQPAPVSVSVPVTELIPDPVDAFGDWEGTCRLDLMVPGSEAVPQPEPESAPETVPMTNPEPKPEPKPNPVPKSAQRSAQKKKTWRLIAVAGAAVAVLVIFCYVGRLLGGGMSAGTQATEMHLHMWEDANCNTPKHCPICGADEGTATGHQWIDATKTEPMRCMRCGETTGTPLLPTVDIGPSSWDVGNPVCSVSGTTAKIENDGWSQFNSEAIEFTVKDVYDKEVPLSYFLVEWKNNAVYVTPQEALPFGVYRLTFEDGSNYVNCMLSFGYNGEQYLNVPDLAFEDLLFVNHVSGGYLMKTTKCLATTARAEDATRFSSPEAICGKEFTTDSGSIFENENMMRFVCRRYWVQGGTYAWVVFEYEGWYLAADSSGKVYLTQELDEACYWVFER